MGGNYEKDIYKHLMELMARCDSLEKDIKSTKSASRIQATSLNHDIKQLNSRCVYLENKNTELLQHVDSLQAENGLLRKENASLKEEISLRSSIENNNSGNTSLPPSSDQKPSKEKKANEYNGREHTGKKQVHSQVMPDPHSPKNR